MLGFVSSEGVRVSAPNLITLFSDLHELVPWMRVWLKLSFWRQTAVRRFLLLAVLVGAIGGGVCLPFLATWTSWVVVRGSVMEAWFDPHLRYFEGFWVAPVWGALAGGVLWLACELARRPRPQRPESATVWSAGRSAGLAARRVALGLFPTLAFLAGVLVHRYSLGPAERSLAKVAAASYLEKSAVQLYLHGDAHSAMAALRSYAELLDTIGEPYDQSWTRESAKGLAYARMSEVALRQGDQESADTLLEQAQATLRTAGWKDVSPEAIRGTLEREREWYE